VAASEYIRRRGNHQVVLCERGIRTFETRTRNTLDVSSVPVLRDLTDLPVIVDPSHAAGHGSWVPALAAAALAAGADGLLVEAHPIPPEAWSDAGQAIDLETCAQLVVEVSRARLQPNRTHQLPGDSHQKDLLLAAVDDEIERLQTLRRQLIPAELV
jgi:3-deoxy-7-phosphoheptulonate synthase